MDDTLYDGTGLAPTGETPTEEPGLEVPDGTLEERLGWVGESDDPDVRRARADAVWDHEVAANDGTTDLDELGRLLTYHVYREKNQAAVVVDDGTPQTDGDGTSYEDAAPSGSAAETVTDGTQAVAVPSEEIPGELVESDTAGTGGAVNAETGEVTAPGEPLPPIESEGGQPLEPTSDTPTEGEQPEQPTP